MARGWRFTRWRIVVGWVMAGVWIFGRWGFVFRSGDDSLVAWCPGLGGATGAGFLGPRVKNGSNRGVFGLPGKKQKNLVRIAARGHLFRSN